MRSRGLSVVLALAFTSVLIRSAHADPKGDIDKKSKEAMESYDLMDYDAAKKALTQALTIAKKGKLDKDPIAARVYLDIGIAAFAASDQEGAKVAFQSAVQIDPKIQIDAAYKSPELVKLLDEARASSAGSEPAAPDVDCKGVKGLQHNILDSARAGTATPLEALVGNDLKPVKVSIMYRPEHAVDFVEVKMTKNQCKYSGQIPAAGMRGSVVHYFVAAYDANNRVIAGKGSAGSPNILELSGAAALKKDEEDPLDSGTPTKKVVATAHEPDDTDGGEVTAGVNVPGKPPKITIAVTAGTGFGYVTGATEGGSSVQHCCIGNSLVVIVPEIGYNISPTFAISIAGRIGLPLGANVDGHATLAPGGLLRFRYALSPSGEGIRVMGQIGAGILRDTITLDGAMTGMDKDIVAQGPLLVGAGIGYIKKLNNSVAFIADLSALAGIAVTKTLGTAVLNSGVGADLSLGLQLGF